MVRTMSTEAAKSGEEGKKKLPVQKIKRRLTKCTSSLGLLRDSRESFSEWQPSCAVATEEYL